MLRPYERLLQRLLQRLQIQVCSLYNGFIYSLSYGLVTLENALEASNCEAPGQVLAGGSAATQPRLRLLAKCASGRRFVANSPARPGSARPCQGGACPLWRHCLRWTRRRLPFTPCAVSAPQGSPRQRRRKQRGFAGAHPLFGPALGQARCASDRHAHILGNVTHGSFLFSLSFNRNRTGTKSAGASFFACRSWGIAPASFHLVPAFSHVHREQHRRAIRWGVLARLARSLGIVPASGNMEALPQSS